MPPSRKRPFGSSKPFCPWLGPFHTCWQVAPGRGELGRLHEGLSWALPLEAAELAPFGASCWGLPLSAGPRPAPPRTAGGRSLGAALRMQLRSQPGKWPQVGMAGPCPQQVSQGSWRSFQKQTESHTPAQSCPEPSGRLSPGGLFLTSLPRFTGPCFPPPPSRIRPCPAPSQLNYHFPGGSSVSSCPPRPPKSLTAQISWLQHLSSQLSSGLPGESPIGVCSWRCPQPHSKLQKPLGGGRGGRCLQASE